MHIPYGGNIMLKENQKFFVVKHIRMMLFLKERGFEPVDIAPDRNNDSYVVWVYRITPEFKEALNEWLRHMEEVKLCDSCGVRYKYQTNRYSAVF